MSGFSVVGNNELCGGITELKLSPCQGKTHKQKQQLLLTVLLAVAGIAICLCLVLSALFLFKRKITVEEIENACIRVLDDKYPRVPYLEILEATDDFAPANLTGAGKYGSLYQGNLSLPSVRNGVAAVKVFNPHQAGSSRTSLAEWLVNALASLASVVRIGISCSRETLPGRMYMKNAAAELHRMREVAAESFVKKCP